MSVDGLAQLASPWVKEQSKSIFPVRQQQSLPAWFFQENKRNKISPEPDAV